MKKICYLNVLSIILTICVTTGLCVALPVNAMAADDPFVAVSAGFSHAMALQEGGTLWAWGWNCRGEVGSGNLDVQDYPIKIMDDVISICTGNFCSYAIKKDGSLWAWGSNHHGMLGTGTSSVDINDFYPETDENQPVYIMSNVKEVTTSSSYSAAIPLLLQVIIGFTYGDTPVI